VTAAATRNRAPGFPCRMGKAGRKIDLALEIAGLIGRKALQIK
jgi:hypothetical protein